MGDHEVGLGCLLNAVLDQHLFARNYQFDMYYIHENRPELHSIGWMRILVKLSIMTISNLLVLVILLFTMTQDGPPKKILFIDYLKAVRNTMSKRLVSNKIWGSNI